MKAVEQILDAIDKAYRSEPRDKQRTYIGASVIGNRCDAYLAYQLRGYPEDPPEPQLKRIFDLGHHIEDTVVRDLKRAGLPIMDRDPSTQKQWTFEAFHGHVIGHGDGLMEDGEDIVLVEIKSMNANKFQKFVDHGLISSHPNYYEQVQLMMGMGKIERCILVAYCKDNSKYHIEEIKFNDFYHNSQLLRIERLLGNKDIERISHDPDDWRCKGCFKYTVCQGITQPKVECRSCKHSVAGTAAGWYCEKHKIDCTTPCKDYETFRAK